MPKQGSTTARGYGANHQAAREAMRPAVEAGLACCSRCGGPITPGEPWDADHTDDRSAYRGPAHRYCNRRAGALKARHSRSRSQPRRWVL